jgi:protein-S-isoprenylcysteine O-methyltransferase Ste14
MKRLALAMPAAIARGAAGYRFRVEHPPAPAARRDLGELAAKVLIVTLFSSMAMRIAQDCAATGHVTGLLLLASEALVVALTMVRRSAAAVDRTWNARILTAVSTFGPPLVRPVVAGALASEPLTIAIAAVGLIIVVLGKLSIGRSFGLVPANRGIVSTGFYRFVRHPIYLGYLVTHAGFVLANPGAWNLLILVAADVALMFRAVCEERTLAKDPAYRAYTERVRWRIVPGVF